MNFSTILAFITAVLTLLVVAVAVYRGRRSFVQGIFAFGMFLFAIEAALTGMVFHAADLEAFLFWQRIRLIAASLLPAAWLLFSVSFARANYLEQISKWKWVILPALIAPLAMTTVFYDSFIALVLAPQNTNTLFIRIGRAGYLWHFFWMIDRKSVV